MESPETIFHYLWLAIAIGAFVFAGIYFFLGITGRETATWFGVNAHVLQSVGYFVLGLGWLFVGPRFRKFLPEIQ